MAHSPTSEQRASDQLLWLAGAVVALVAGTWLLLAEPWSDLRTTPTVAVLDPAGPPTRAAASLPAPAAPAEPNLDDTLRLARLALDAGMLLEPAGYGAWDLYGGVLEQVPDHPAAIAGLVYVADALVERGRTALQQGRTSDAEQLATLIQARLPAHAGGRELAQGLAARAAAELDAAPTQRPAAAAVSAPSRSAARPAPPDPDPVPAVEAQFEQALADNRLLAPEADSAKSHLANLSAIAPAHEATRRARERLFERFIALAEQATDSLDAQAARTWIDEAAVLGIHADTVKAASDTLLGRLVAAESNRLIAASDLTLLHYVPPEYPQRAVARGTEGWVDVEFAIDTEGRTRDVVVTSASHESLFHESALAAVAQWQFAPRSFMGQPIAQRAFTRIRFAFE